MTVQWHVYSPTAYVAFPFPCVRMYGEPGDDFKCPEPFEGHGHVMFGSDEDGFAWIPFPVESKAGFEAVLTALSSSHADFDKIEKALLALPDVSSLPHKLTANETRIISDPALYRHMTKYTWR